MDILDLPVVLVSAKIFLLGIHVVFKPLKSLDLDWINLSHYIPVDVLGARWIGNRSFVKPSVLVINRVKGISDLEEGGHFVIMVFKFELPEKILESLVVDLVDFLEFFDAEHDCGGGVLDTVSFHDLSIMIHL